MTRPRPLRVLHVIPSVWDGSGGPTRAVIEMCRALAAAEPTALSDIATTDHGLTAEWRAYVESRLPPTTALHVFPESRWLDPGWSLPLARWVWRHVRAYDVVHVHALLNGTSAAAMLLARRRGVPYVVRPLGTLSRYTFANRRARLKRVYHALVDGPALRACGAVQFTAPQEATKAAGRFPAGREIVIPLPFDVDGEVGRAGRDRPATPGGVPEILFMARLHPVKGLDVLLPAAARLRAAGTPFRLTIAGAGSPEYERWVRAEVERLGLDDLVELTGHASGEAKRALLARADVFALPSHQENFGVAIVEALAAGLPVVISREVDIWPDVDRYGSGIAVESDPARVADALAALLGDVERRARCGAAGRRQVADLYSPEAVGRGLARVYRELAAGAPGAPAASARRPAAERAAIATAP